MDLGHVTGIGLLPALLAAALAVLLERAVAGGLRALLLAREGRSDAAASRTWCYHRNPWAFDRGDLLAVLAALALSGGLAATALDHGADWLLPAALLWAGALGWDLWTWERVACSVESVSWRRGWRSPVRRAPVIGLRSVRVTRGHAWGRQIPGWLQPGSHRLVLELSDGMAVELPRTGDLFGGRASVEQVARFLRTQIAEVATHRRLAANDRRAAARRDQALPATPLHQAAHIEAVAPLSLVR